MLAYLDDVLYNECAINFIDNIASEGGGVAPVLAYLGVLLCLYVLRLVVFSDGW